MMRDFDQRQRIRRGLQQREPLHFTRRHGFDFAALEKPFQGEYLADAQGGGAQLPDELVSFGYEQPCSVRLRLSASERTSCISALVMVAAVFRS